jgi:hypothetical protein
MDQMDCISLSGAEIAQCQRTPQKVLLFLAKKEAFLQKHILLYQLKCGIYQVQDNLKFARFERKEWFAHILFKYSPFKRKKITSLFQKARYLFFLHIFI